MPSPLLDVWSGSNATELGCPRDVRFPSDSDQTADISVGPVRANKRHHDLRPRFAQQQVAGASSRQKSLRASRFYFLPCITRWRQSNMAGECDAERACGAVADTFSNFGDASLLPPPQGLCQSHT